MTGAVNIWRIHTGHVHVVQSPHTAPAPPQQQEGGEGQLQQPDPQATHQCRHLVARVHVRVLGTAEHGEARHDGSCSRKNLNDELKSLSLSLSLSLW